MWCQAFLLAILTLSFQSSVLANNDSIASRLPTLTWFEYENEEAIYLVYSKTNSQMLGSNSPTRTRRYPTDTISSTDILGYKNKTFTDHLSSIGYDTYWHQHVLLKAFSCYYVYNELGSKLRQGSSSTDECFIKMLKALARANNTWVKENQVPFSRSNIFFNNQFIVCIEEILIRGSTAHFDWIHGVYTKDSPTTNF
jgi:hypothetical protein